MNILVLTGYWGDKYNKSGAISSANKAQYAAKYGYDFLCLRSSYNGYKDPGSWFKLEWIRKNIDNWDWIFWTDSDALIMNQDIPLESIIDNKFPRVEFVHVSQIHHLVELIEAPPLDEDKNYIISYDNSSPCMGNFLIRNCEWSRKFLGKILSLKEKYLESAHWDNDAQDFLYITEPDLMRKVDFIPSGVLNSGVKDYKEGDFILHWYATTEKSRLERALELSLLDFEKAKLECWENFYNKKAYREFSFNRLWSAGKELSP